MRILIQSWKSRKKFKWATISNQGPTILRTTMFNLENLGLRIYRTVNSFWEERLFRHHSNRLNHTIPVESTEHRQYLNQQLARTLPKRSTRLQKRTRILIDQTATFASLPKADVLCIGCRNTAEIDYFRMKKAQSVTGIDLYSQDPSIQIMDMHQMTFADNSFDVIYSSHSLEHAKEITKVVQEILRVARPGATIAIEVPVNYEPSGADLIDFSSLDHLHQFFAPYIDQVYWSESLTPSDPGCEAGTPIIRTIFRLKKDAKDGRNPIPGHSNRPPTLQNPDQKD